MARHLLTHALAGGWLALLASGAGCAHAGAVPVDRANVVERDESVIVLRFAALDAGEAERVQHALRVAVPRAERWGPLPERLTITLHPSHEALEAASRIRGVDWMRAWARRDTIDLQSPRTWTSGTAGAVDLEQFLTHELTHCVMYQAIGNEKAALGVPAWFREGMASVNAGQRFRAPIPTSSALPLSASFSGEDAPLAYVVAHEAFLALEWRYGPQRIRAILSGLRRGARFSEAFEKALGTSLSAFEAEFVASPPPTAG